MASLIFGGVVFGFFYGLKVLVEEDDKDSVGSVGSVSDEELVEEVGAAGTAAGTEIPSITPVGSLADEAAGVVTEEGAEVATAEDAAAEEAVSAEADIVLINKYYECFWVDELAEAYAMKYEPEESFKTFKGWYQNTEWANPYDFDDLGDHTYNFYVNLMEEDGTNERYDVTMQVIGSKLKTISSKKVSSSMIDEEAVFNDSVKAFVKWEGGDENLYVSKNGVDVLADSITDRSEWSNKFSSFEYLRFSKSGRYLMYMISGWEAVALKVYDTVDLKTVHKVVTSGGFMEFTDDEKHLYQCEGTGFSGGFIEVYSVPGFELEKDLFQMHGGYEVGSGVGAGGECEYDSATNSLKYNLWMMGVDPAEDSLPWYTYYFEG